MRHTPVEMRHIPVEMRHTPVEMRHTPTEMFRMFVDLSPTLTILLHKSVISKQTSVDLGITVTGLRPHTIIL